MEDMQNSEDFVHILIRVQKSFLKPIIIKRISCKNTMI